MVEIVGSGATHGGLATDRALLGDHEMRSSLSWARMSTRELAERIRVLGRSAALCGTILSHRRCFTPLALAAIERSVAGRRAREAVELHEKEAFRHLID